MAALNIQVAVVQTRIDQPQDDRAPHPWPARQTDGLIIAARDSPGDRRGPDGIRAQVPVVTIVTDIEGLGLWPISGPMTGAGPDRAADGLFLTLRGGDVLVLAGISCPSRGAGAISGLLAARLPRLSYRHRFDLTARRVRHCRQSPPWHLSHVGGTVITVPSTVWTGGDISTSPRLRLHACGAGSRHLEGAAALYRRGISTKGPYGSADTVPMPSIRCLDGAISRPQCTVISVPRP